MSELAQLLAGPKPATAPANARTVARMSAEDRGHKSQTHGEPSTALLVRVALFIAANPGCPAMAAHRGVTGDTNLIALSLAELRDAGIVRCEGRKPRLHWIVDDLPARPLPRMKGVVHALRGLK